MLPMGVGVLCRGSLSSEENTRWLLYFNYVVAVCILCLFLIWSKTIILDFGTVVKSQTSRLARAIVTLQCDKCQNLSCSLKWRFRDHLSWAFVTVPNIICWLAWKVVCQKRRLWWFCTFAQACLSLRHSTKISCVGSNDDLCPIYTSSEGSRESAPANIAIVCNHRFVVSMLLERHSLHCNKIPQ